MVTKVSRSEGMLITFNWKRGLPPQICYRIITHHFIAGALEVIQGAFILV